MLDGALLVSQEDKHVHAAETAGSPKAPRRGRFRRGCGGPGPAEEDSWHSDSSSLQKPGPRYSAARIRFVH
jgi:hypothetical protein